MSSPQVGPLNERITFLAAAVCAELSVSILPCLFLPADPLCSGSLNLLNYTGQHLTLAAGLWAIAFAAAWVIAGRRLVRPRQNLSTKLRLLASLGVIGLLIDTAVSLYQFQSSSNAGTAASSAILASLAVRIALYALIFTAAIAVCWLISRNQRPTVTPPPRFGRE